MKIFPVGKIEDLERLETSTSMTPVLEVKDSAVAQRGLKQRQGKANNLQAESNKSKPQDVSSKP
uniref:Uncharacterized protein n=1 Tax=Timema douglasi TaxID=61478 RepID=A0A7R8VXK3_TIMDO|nr:unnamed protein product [Timema douglasi]